VAGERADAAAELLERGDELVARRHGRARARRQVELGVARGLERGVERANQNRSCSTNAGSSIDLWR
jgi:hypothetical protein